MQKTFSWYNPLDEGDVVGDGISDDAPGLQRALDKVSTGSASGSARGGTLVLPPGRFRLGSGLRIDNTIRIIGSGGYHTFLEPDPGVTALTISANSNGQRRWDNPRYDSLVSQMGTHLQDFHVLGTNGDDQTGIVWENSSDRCVTLGVRTSHCDTGWIVGGLGDTTGFIRESEWIYCSVDHCGTLSGRPAISIETNDPVTGGSDGTNHLVFTGLRAVYNYGPFLIEDKADTEFLRRIIFNYLMLHGRNSQDPGTGFPDSMQIRGALTDVQMYGLMTNGSGPGGACIRIQSGATSFPPRSIHVSGTISSSTGDGIVVEQAQSFMFNLQQAGTVEGDFVRVDSNAFVGNRPSYLNVVAYGETTAFSPTINIASTEREQLHGYWDGLQRLAGNVEVIDNGGSPRTLSIPNTGGTVTAV